MKESVILSIAGQTVKVSGDKSMQLFTKAVGFHVFVEQSVETCDDMIEFAFDRNVDDSLFESYLSFEVFNEKYCFGENDGKFKVSIEKLDGDKHKFIMEQVSPNRFIANEACNSDQVRAALWYAFIYFCSQRSLFTMHASCIIYKGEAVLFLGKSGTGKSTHTKLWYDNFEGATLLNDDCPIIQIGDKIIVHGSPWSGKTPCYKRQNFPLKAIVKLKQAPENNILKLDRKKSVAAIYSSFQPILTESEALSDKVFEAMSAIISKIPVFHLDCLPNLDAALLSRKMIFGE